MSSLQATSEQGDLVSELQERAGKVWFLSRLFACRPDAAVLADAKAVELVDKDWSSQVEDVQVEYTRLFSAPGDNAIPVHQSVYTDTFQMESSPPDPTGCGMSFPGGQFQGYLGGKSCMEVACWYKETGFQPSKDFPQMADHISVELEFMAYLYDSQARAVESGLNEDAEAFQELRNDFFKRFIGRWLETFLQKVAANKVSVFYRQIASNFRSDEGIRIHF